MDEALSMVKGDERFIFRYHRGEEELLPEQFAAMACDEKTNFDWHDSAVMSFQLGRRLEIEN